MVRKLKSFCILKSMQNNFLLHLSLITGLGPAVAEKIIGALQEQGIPATQWGQLSVQEILRFCKLSEKTTKALEGLKDQSLLEHELARIEKYAVKWVTILDDAYPALLKNIYLPPIVLYYWGANLKDISVPIALVGSRNASEYGYRAINAFVPELVRNGCTIVSGGALGIDSRAHQVTLDAGGKTIAVIGSGLLKPYPSQNRDLFNAIVRSGGIVMSPFPLTMGALPGNFPARNRIISGLSCACLVVQAAAKSGALITARYALEQGRDVGAVPGAFDDPLSAGCHALIQEGALCVSGVTEALQLAGIMQEVTCKQLPVISETKNVKDPILSLCAQPISFDELLQKTGFNETMLYQRLFELQLEGALEQNFMGLWVIV